MLYKAVLAGLLFSANVPVTIHHKGGTKAMQVNQQRTADGWVRLGNYRFEEGKNGEVIISNKGTDGMVEADAFKVELLKETR